MRMRLLSLMGILAAASSFAVDLPRQSPEFVINLPNGEKQLLSKYRGKVVLVEFLHTTCSHCQHTVGVFSKLQDEFGGRGFQALGIAFNEMSNMLIPDFLKEFKPSFTVGWANRDPALAYLGISTTERFVVPQVVLMDKKGGIRFQSPPLGDPNLQDDKYLRARIEELLTGVPERKPSAAVKSAPAASALAKKPTTAK